MSSVKLTQDGGLYRRITMSSKINTRWWSV